MTTLEPLTMSTAEAAAMLNVSVQTVQKWTDAGFLEGWRTVGGHRRIESESVARMLADRRARKAQQLRGGTPRGVNPLAAVVVDDDPADRDLACALLARHFPGLDVVPCTDGYTGLIAIGRVAPAVLVTDVVMPYVDGFELVRRVADTEFAPRAIIACSSYRRDELRHYGDLPDTAVFIEKPLRAEPLVAAVARAVGPQASGASP